MSVIIVSFLGMKKVFIFRIVITGGDGSFFVDNLWKIRGSRLNGFLNKITTVFIDASVLKICFPRS